MKKRTSPRSGRPGLLSVKSNGASRACGGLGAVSERSTRRRAFLATNPHARKWGGHQKAPSQPAQGGHCVALEGQRNARLAGERAGLYLCFIDVLGCRRRDSNVPPA